jgi:hypothetical protein
MITSYIGFGHNHIPKGFNIYLTLIVAMLTRTQKAMLAERKEKGESIDIKRKKYIDFTLRNYIKKQLNSIIDVSEVMRVLPKNQVREVIGSEHIIEVLKLLEKISSICLAPIEFDENGEARAVYRFQLVEKLDAPIEGKDQMVIDMKCSFPAEPWEIEFWKKLGTEEFKPYMRVLTNLFENEFGMIRFNMEDETYGQWLTDLANKRAQIPKIEAGKQILVGAAMLPELSDLQIETIEKDGAEK